jgi:hypothetical protein
MKNEDWIKLTPTAKLAELKRMRDEYRIKLKEMYRNFRGVKHENSLSELRYSELKVAEDMLGSVLREIKDLEEKLQQNA